MSASDFFSQPAALAHLRTGVFGAHVDGFADAMRELEYARFCIRYSLQLTRHFGAWLAARGRVARQADESAVLRFLATRKAGLQAAGLMRALLAYLRQLRVIPPARIRGPRVDEVEQRFRAFLQNERGLAAKTVKKRLRDVRVFRRQLPRRCRALERLRARDVTRALISLAGTMSLPSAANFVVSLRVFFRFLVMDGISKVDLTAAVPPVAKRRPAIQPRLTPADVAALVRHRESAARAAVRDRAIVLLAARLGLRSSEIVGLTLEDIDWARAELIVHGKSRQVHRLSIPLDVGKAIARYLRNHRPRSRAREVFLRALAPYRALGGSSTVYSVIRRAMRRSGVSASQHGPHILRHTLATRMLRGGATIPEISHVLGHQSVDTSRIYARHDVNALRGVARPWPRVAARP
jgi:site-specific recombinase XerD